MTFQPRAAIPSARETAAELGCGAVDAETGSVLRFLACTLRARAVVEVGTGAGVSGLYLLDGMPVNGVLTSIDVEPKRQRAARVSFGTVGFGPARSRLITGRAADVLPRLSPASYDLVLLDAALPEYPRYFELALPLLRIGGVLAFHITTSQASNGHDANGRRAGDDPDSDDPSSDDPSSDDPDSIVFNSIGNAIRLDDRLVPACFPLPSPLLVVSRGA